MKTVSRKKKPLGLDAILANLEADIAALVDSIAAERKAMPAAPRRRTRAPAKARAHAA